jgi:acyl-coenzyme A synthetase/AMP-(fatty) acid ligase
MSKKYRSPHERHKVIMPVNVARGENLHTSESLVCGSWFSAPTNMRLDHGGPVDVPFEYFDDYWIARPIIERFEYIVARHGERIAVDDGNTRLTYRELMRASMHLALRIHVLVPPRAPIGVLLPNSALLAVAALAALAAGRPFVPMDGNYPTARNEQIMAEAGVRTLLTEPADAETAKAFTAVPQLDLAASLAGGAESGLVGMAIAAGPAMILYTSGTTGRPKGICHDQRWISLGVAQFTNSCHVNADDRIILLSSVLTPIGIRNLFAALLNGAALIIADLRKLGTHGVLHTLWHQRITICSTIPVLMREIMHAKDARDSLAGLRLIRLSSDSTHFSDIARLRAVLPSSCHIRVAYACTEMGPVFQWFVPPDWTADGPQMPCGYLMPETFIALASDEGAPSHDGQVGELMVKSRYLALGLWQNGCLQPGPFREDPADPSFRVLHTGDLLRLREDGLAEFIGRKDRQVKIRGLRVNPGEVEHALRRCQGVADAVVTGSHDDESGTSLVAYVVPSRPAGTSFVHDLQAAIANHLPGHMRPTHVHVVSEIPLLPSFKPDSAGAAQSSIVTAGIREMRQPAVVLSDRVNKAVSRAWTRVLRRQSFDSNEHWDEAGGDSLKALRLWLVIEEALGVQLPFEAFGERATPFEIGAAVERLLAAAARPANPRPAYSRVAELICLHQGNESNSSIIYCLPTVSGSVVSYLPLANLIGLFCPWN